MSPTSLAKLTPDDKLLQVFDNIKNSIAEIDDFKELLNLSNLANGFETSWQKYYRASGLGLEQMFYGWETKVRCERKMGQLILNAPKKKNQYDNAAFTLEEAFGLNESRLMRLQKLAEIVDNEFDKKIQELWASFKEPTTAELFRTAHVSHNSGEDEWYTPPTYIEAARKTMGSINLDPASSGKANEIVRAEKFFTANDDGLSKEWFGNIWLNPPYSQPLIDEFANKLNDSEIEQACVLVNNATETAWFQTLLKKCVAICLIKGRVKFIDVNGKASGAPLQGQMILYYGKRVQEFKDNFGGFGKILWTEEK